MVDRLHIVRFLVLLPPTLPTASAGIQNMIQAAISGTFQKKNWMNALTMPLFITVSCG
jgi:hypothetical protein